MDLDDVDELFGEAQEPAGVEDYGAFEGAGEDYGAHDAFGGDDPLEQGNPEAANEFEAALGRINKSKKSRRIGPMKAKEAKRQAEMLVDTLNRLHRQDLDAARKDEPAGHKLAAISHIKLLINRRGFHLPFLMDQGLVELRKWLEPLPLNKFLPPNATEQQKREMQNRAEVPVEVLRGTLHCIQVLSPYISKDDVKGSAIGIALRAVKDDPRVPVEVRVQATQLTSDLVNIVIGLKRPREENEGDTQDRKLLAQEEAVEVDERGRKVAKVETKVALPSSNRMKSELEKQRLWAPDEAFQKTIDERLHTRHAVMPTEKPVFDPAAAPLGSAPAKRPGREDPNSAMGRVQNQLKKISNPNKKQWKSTVGQVSISGSSLNYNF